jgi:RNA polymerase sigma-70 factor (ECF subfamily)
MSMGGGEGRAAEYRALFRDVYDDAVRFAMRRADPADADEAVAAAMTIVWQRFDHAPESFDARRAWVFGIVRKTLLNQRRGATRRAALAVRVAENVELTHVDDVSSIELRRDLAVAWRTLSAAQQEVLALGIFEQLDPSDAARTLGVLPGTYRVRLTRAKKALQAALAHHAPSAAPLRALINQEAS